MARYKEKFITTLVSRIAEVLGNPKNRVRCVFPVPLIELLSSSLEGAPNLEMMSFLTLTHFENLIRQSDVVFYWNVFSNSILLCYYYDIPFLCFEKGHVAELSPQLFQHMSVGIYHKGHPEFVDWQKPFPNDLSTLLNNCYSLQNREQILAEYQQLPSPDSIVKKLVNG